MAALAYVLATALHEHGGHSLACVLAGSRPLEMGAFYVQCKDNLLGPAAIRWVALAGPLASFATGAVCCYCLPRSRAGSIGHFFLWLLGGIGLMSGTGYLLFSGASGIGDLGFDADGALHRLGPEWAWRIALLAVGAPAYFLVVRFLCRLIATAAGPADGPNAVQYRRATILAYGSGALIQLLIGSFNPIGWQIVLLSALPSSLGATSGLLWMWPVYRRATARSVTGPGTGLDAEQRPDWIIVALLAIALYTAVFGRTLVP